MSDAGSRESESSEKPTHRILRTTCTCDCPDTCSITALVHGGEISLFGSADHQITRGYICAKMRHYYQRLVASPTRIVRPRMRTRNGFRDISWNEAYDVICSRLGKSRDAGRPEEIAYINGAGSISALKQVTGFFFRKFGATVLSTDLCSPCARTAQAHSFGKRTCHDPRDVLNSGSIWLWGRNLHVTNSHFIPIISAARKQGSRLFVVDPRKTAAADMADRHFRVRPDGDWAMTAGMIRVLLDEERYDAEFCGHKTANFEEFRKKILELDPSMLAANAGISETGIAEAAHLFAGSPPSTIWFGWGMQHGPNAYESVRLLDALGAVTGNVGIVGGGVNHGRSEYDYFNNSIVECEPKRSIPSVALGKTLSGDLDPPIRAAFVFTSNPAASWPDLEKVRKGLESLELLVVVDREMTETARRAHLVLPATCFLEEDDLVGSYFHNWVGRVTRISEPPPEAKSDMEIVAALASRLGMELECGGDASGWITRFLEGSERYGITPEALKAGPVEASTSQHIPFDDGVFPTPSGKFEFITSLPVPKKPESETLLLTTRSSKNTNTTGRAGDYEGSVRAFITPADAKRVGLPEGARAVIESASGSVDVEISLAERLSPGIINIHIGGPAAGNAGVNLLTDGSQTTEGHGPVFNAIPVTLQRRGK